MNNTIRRVLLFICIGIFLFSSYKLFKIIQQYRKIDTENQKAINLASNREKENEDGDWYFECDIVSMQRANKDIGGWIKIPDTKIDYPLLCPSSNESYIRRTWNGKYSIGGSIWKDPKSEIGEGNAIIYGHRMKDGSMFGGLKKFLDEEYREEHPYIYLFYKTKEYRYKITGCQVVSTNSDIYRHDYKGEGNMITLSTCTGDDDTRLIVTADFDKIVWEFVNPNDSKEVS